MARTTFTAVLAAVLSLSAHAQCVSELRPVAQLSVFPNRPAGLMAWSGSRFGIVKTEPQTRSNPIWFSVSDASLNTLTPDRAIVTTSGSGALALLWDGSAFGLFYEVSDQLLYQRLDTNANKIGAAVPIGNKPAWPGQEYAIAFNPVLNAYVVVHVVPQGLGMGFYIRTVNPDGAIVRESVVTGAAGIITSPRIAVASNGSMLVAWQYKADVFAPATEFQDVVYTKDFVRTSLNILAGVGEHLIVSTNGTTFLAALTVAGTPPLSEIHTIAIDANGRAGANTKVVTAREKDVAPLSLLWNPSRQEWALVYVDAPTGLNQFPTDTRLRRFTASNALIADVEFSPDPGRYYLDARYSAIFDGNSYVGSSDRYLGAIVGSEGFVVRHCPFFISGAAEPAVIPVNGTTTLRITPSGGSPDYKYQWDTADFNVFTAGPVVSHKYTRTGTYTVSVTATDQQGAVSTTTFTVKVVTPKGRAVRH